MRSRRCSSYHGSPEWKTRSWWLMGKYIIHILPILYCIYCILCISICIISLHVYLLYIIMSYTISCIQRLHHDNDHHNIFIYTWVIQVETAFFHDKCWGKNWVKLEEILQIIKMNQNSRCCFIHFHLDLGHIFNESLQLSLWIAAEV